MQNVLAANDYTGIDGRREYNGRRASSHVNRVDLEDRLETAFSRSVLVFWQPVANLAKLRANRRIMDSRANFSLVINAILADAPQPRPMPTTATGGHHTQCVIGRGGPEPTLVSSGRSLRPARCLTKIN